MDKKITILICPHVVNQTILSLAYSYLSVISLLLLLCNDIHPNPGPLSNNSRCELRNISIVNMNVNSLRNKTELISTELGDHDIICITESRLNNTVSSSDITIDNFINPEAFRKDRLTDSGGGILIYIRNTLLGRRRLDLEVPEVESVCLEIFADNRKFLLVCLYRPPNARVSSWDYIDNLFDKCVDSGISNCVFLGDINVDLFTIGNNHKFTRSCQRLGLENVIHEPTRITSSSSTLIDPILVNNYDIVRDSYVLPNFCSDHCPSIIEINFSVTREKSYLKTIWDYDNANYIAINQHLQNTDWDMKFGDSDNVNTINEVINLELNSAMNTYIPKKIIRVRPRDKPWINSETKCKIRKRNRVHKKAKFRNLASDWENFRRIRNDIIDMIREAK